MNWTDRYIGIPFAEKGRTPRAVDCWGLVQLVFRTERGIELPSYTEDYVGIAERAEIAHALQRAYSDPWRRVESGAKDFNVAMFRRGRVEAHVGLVCGPGLMLHVEEGRDVRIESYNTAPWADRLIGVFRHMDLA